MTVDALSQSPEESKSLTLNNRIWKLMVIRAVSRKMLRQ